MSDKVDYIVDLSSIGRGISITSAPSSRKAVANILAKKVPRKQISPNMHALDDMEGVANYAFLIPEITAEDGTSIPQHQYELCQEVALASEIANRRGGPEKDYLPKARQMLEAYRANRINHQQAY